jgi:hypothetical protein
VNLNFRQMWASSKNRYLCNQRARFKPILDSNDLRDFVSLQLLFRSVNCAAIGLLLGASNCLRDMTTRGMGVF